MGFICRLILLCFLGRISPKSKITDPAIECVVILMISYSWDKSPHKGVSVVNRVLISGYPNLQSDPGLN